MNIFAVINYKTVVILVITVAELEFLGTENVRLEIEIKNLLENKLQFILINCELLKLKKNVIYFRVNVLLLNYKFSSRIIL